MEHSLDVIPVRIQHVGAVVTRVIASFARPAVVRTPCLEPGLVEPLDRFGTIRLKGEVRWCRRIPGIVEKLWRSGLAFRNLLPGDQQSLQTLSRFAK